MEQEIIIERHYDGFMAVGMALAKIRDHRLYKHHGFTTFETYCRKRWKMGRRHADRTIDAARFVAAANETNWSQNARDQALPATEGAARAAIAAARPAPVNVPPAIRQHLEEHVTELPITVPVGDSTARRCEEIMAELRANRTLAMLVRVEIMKWYALNT